MNNLPARRPDVGDPVFAKPMPPRVAEKSIDIGSVWNVIRAGKWLIFSALFITTLFAFLYSIFSEPTYEASSTVSINTRGSMLPGAEVTLNRPVVTDEIGLLQRSSELAMQVSTALVESAKSYGTNAYYPILQEYEASGDEIVGTVAGQLWRQMSYRDLGSGMISITAQSSSRQEAQHLANLFAEQYQILSKERSRASIVAARQFLERQFKEGSDTLRAIEMEYVDVMDRNDLVRQGTGGELTVAKYGELSALREEARREVTRLQLEKASLESQLETATESISSSSSGSLQLLLDEADQNIASLTQKLEAAYRNNPATRTNPESVPTVKQWVDDLESLKERRRDLQSRLLNESSNSGGVGSDYALQTRQRLREIDLNLNERQNALRGYNSELASLGSNLDAIPLKIFQVEQIQRRRQSAEEWVRTLATDLQNYRTAEAAELGYVEVVKDASLPLTPVKPDLQMNVLMALLFGFAGGVGLAFVRTAVRQKLDTPDQVAGMGYPLLGSVPLLTREIKTNFKGKQIVEINGKKRSTALVTLHSPWSPASEHYRLVRTNLQLAADGSVPKVLMITSPEPGDGKSVTSLNLAISIAHSGARTLIIDADLRRPTQHRLLDASISPGLADMLTSNDDFGDLDEYATDIESLFFLPAGKTLVPPPELFGSPRMLRLIEHLKHKFDTIIVDTPPVLAVTDSLILSPYCDAAVIVVSANKTTPKAINAAIASLENVRMSIAGVVFNRHDTNRNKTGYYDYSDDYSYASNE